MESEAVYHHLIPQTYMREWKHGKSSVYLVDKGTKNFGVEKSTKRFGGIDHYHSLRAGSPFRTEEDCKRFFKPLEDYIVEIDHIVINSTLEMNNRFYEFDIWVISHTNGGLVSETEKKALKNKIQSIHVRDIEVGWNLKYENYWNSIVTDISKEVYENSTAQKITAIRRDDLIKFMVSLEWRTKPYHPRLSEALDFFCNNIFDFKSIHIPENERLYPFLETAYDEMAHSYILKLFREFLNEGGPIKIEAKTIIDELCTELFLAPAGFEFLTSDNPVCRFTNCEGTTEYIFPLTPKIACRVSRGDNQSDYFLKEISKEELFYYNNKLKDNCYKAYILREQNLALYFDN